MVASINSITDSVVPLEEQQTTKSIEKKSVPLVAFERQGQQDGECMCTGATSTHFFYARGNNTTAYPFGAETYGTRSSVLRTRHTSCARWLTAAHVQNNCAVRATTKGGGGSIHYSTVFMVARRCCDANEYTVVKISLQHVKISPGSNATYSSYCNVRPNGIITVCTKRKLSRFAGNPTKSPTNGRDDVVLFVFFLTAVLL